MKKFNVKIDVKWTNYEDDENEPRTIPENGVPLDNFNVSLTDALINAEVLLHQGEDNSEPLVKARVLKHLTDENGNLIGHANENLILNSLMYEIGFPDGRRVPYVANQIAAEIYAQVDTKGIRDLIIDEIKDHNIDTKHPVNKSKAFFYYKDKKRS